MDKELITKIGSYIMVHQDLPTSIENYDDITLKNAINELMQNNIITKANANVISKLDNGKTVQSQMKAYIFWYEKCQRVYGFTFHNHKRLERLFRRSFYSERTVRP